MIVECQICNKMFNRKPSEIGKNIFCSRECFAEFQGRDKKNNGNYRGGKNVPCKECGSMHYRKPQQISDGNGKFFCSKKCFEIWRSKHLVGAKASNFKNAQRRVKCDTCGTFFKTYQKTQKYCSVECKNKSISKKVKVSCSHCGIELFRQRWEVLKKKHFFCSVKCREKHLVGEKSPNYIKDRANLKNRNHSIRWSKKMSDWRKSVYIRDNYTCQMCGARSRANSHVTLNAHHIKTFSKHKNLRFNPSNGITLCEECHKKTYRKEKKFEPLFLSLILKPRPRQPETQETLQ